MSPSPPDDLATPSPGLSTGHAALLRQQDALRERQRQVIERVRRLGEARVGLNQELGEDLDALREQSQALAREEPPSGGIVSWVRRLGGRRAEAGRRTVAEGLLRQVDVTTRRLREAAAFVDELSLCAAELNAEIDHLHADHAEALVAQRQAAEQVFELERQLREAEREATDMRRVDRLSHALREQAVQVQVLRARAALSEENIGPTRALHDTVMSMVEGLSGYLISATAAVDAAGMRARALAVAADTPVVIAELQASIDDLGAAMAVTATYVRDTREMLERVLPELERRTRRDLAAGTAALTERGPAAAREAALGLAERALIESAAELEEG